jgi:hypothetical protein
VQVIKRRRRRLAASAKQQQDSTITLSSAADAGELNELVTGGSEVRVRVSQ